MAQTNYTPISLYYSTTASAVPTAANLVPGELAINTNDGKLYYEDSSGVVQVLATKSTGSIGGSNTQVQFNNSGSLGGSSGLTWDGSFLTTSSIKNSALTSGRVTYAGASGLLTDSASFTYNGTTLTATTGANFATSSGYVGIGTSSPDTTTLLTVAGAITVTGANTGHGASRLKFGQDTSAISQIRFYGANTSTAGILQFTGSSSDSSVGAERMRIDALGNVGIGTITTTAAPLTVSGLTTSTSTPILYLQQGGSAPNYGYAFKIDNQTTGNLLLNRYDNPNTDIGTLLTLTSSGNLGIGVTPACILDISSSAGGQIKFPATQNASSNANTLDDYEEGTWTPTLTPGSGVLLGYTSVGSYIKIGQFVIVWFRVDITSAGTAAGIAQIGSLPFITRNTSGSTQTTGVAREDNVTGTFYGSYILNSSTTISVSQFGGYTLGVTWINGYAYVGTIVYQTTQ